MIANQGGAPPGGRGGGGPAPAPAPPAPKAAPAPAPTPAPTPAPSPTGNKSPAPAPTANKPPTPAPSPTPNNKPETVTPAPSRKLAEDRQATQARGASYAPSPQPMDLPRYPVNIDFPSNNPPPAPAPMQQTPVQQAQAKPPAPTPTPAGNKPPAPAPSPENNAPRNSEQKSAPNSAPQNDPQNTSKKFGVDYPGPLYREVAPYPATQDAYKQGFKDHRDANYRREFQDQTQQAAWDRGLQDASTRRKELEKSLEEKKANRQIPKKDLPTYEERSAMTAAANLAAKHYGANKEEARRKFLEAKTKVGERIVSYTAPDEPNAQQQAQSNTTTNADKPKRLGRGRQYPHWPTDKQKADIVKEAHAFYKDNNLPEPASYRGDYKDAIDRQRAQNRWNNPGRASEFRKARENKIATETNRRRLQASQAGGQAQAAPVGPPSASAIPPVTAPNAGPNEPQMQEPLKRVTQNDTPIRHRSAWLSVDRKKQIKAQIEEFEERFPDAGISKREGYRSMINAARPNRIPPEEDPYGPVRQQQSPPQRRRGQQSSPGPQPTGTATATRERWGGQIAQLWMRNRPYGDILDQQKQGPRPHERLDVDYRTLTPNSAHRQPEQTWGAWLTQKLMPDFYTKRHMAEIENQSDSRLPFFMRMLGVQNGRGTLGLPYKWRMYPERSRVSVQYASNGQRRVSPEKAVHRHELSWTRLADRDKVNAARGHATQHGATFGRTPFPREMRVFQSHAAPAHKKRYTPDPHLSANMRAPNPSSIYAPTGDPVDLAQSQQRRGWRRAPRQTDAAFNDPLADLFGQAQQAQGQAAGGGQAPPFGHAVMDETVTDEWLKNQFSCKGENCDRCCKFANQKKGNWDGKSGINPRNPVAADEWVVEENGSKLPLNGAQTHSLHEKRHQQQRSSL